MARRPRKKHLVLSVIIIVLSWIVYLGQQQGWFGMAGQAVESNQPGLYTVSHYVDGDTIAVNMNGKSETIRFIGIDTPETHKPNTPVQCYGPAAAVHTRNAIKAQGGKVRLASDPLSTNRDRYNRLLRYVYLPDGTDLNELNIQEGYAFYYPYFPFSKSKQFETDEKQAMAASKGLWGNCHPTPSDGGGYKMDETQAEAGGA